MAEMYALIEDKTHGNILLAASRSQTRMDPDWDPATRSSSLALICRLSMGVVWPDKLCNKNHRSQAVVTDTDLGTV